MTMSRGLGLDDPLRERALLADIVATVTSGLKLDDLAQGVARIITDATDTDVCFVHLLDDQGDRLVLYGATPPFDALAGRITLPIGEGVAGWVAAHGEPAVLDDKFADPRYLYIAELRGEEFASMASVPMRGPSGELVGVLNVHSRERRHFSPADVTTLQSIGNLMAGAVENARLHRRLTEREHAREQFAERLIAAQEQERSRLAGEIHDGISQRIVGLSYHLTAAARAVGRDDTFVSEQITAARRLAADALDETRDAIAGLRPSVLDDLGLAAGIESLVRSLADIEVELQVEECALPDHVETAIYRIAQEAIQNVAKHAEAAHLEVRLSVGEHGTGALLVVADDGLGFDPAARREGLVPDTTGRIAYGLTGMRERADLVGARLQVTSRPGGGTTITVTVP